MKKKLSYFCIALASVLVCLLCSKGAQTYAAGSVSSSVSSVSGEIGETKTVNVTISSSEEIGVTELILSYDPEMVEITGGVDTSGAGTARLIDTSTYSTKTFSISVKILKNGSSALSVSEGSRVCNMEGEYMQIYGSSGLITGITQENYSNDNSLSSLQISPGSLYPSFSPDTTSYSVSVENSCERLAVSAYANDDNASVSVSGTYLSVGTNYIYVTVTAENGEQRTYTLRVTRAAGENETQQEGESQTPEENTDDGGQLVNVNVNGTDFIISDDFTMHPLPSGFSEADYEYDGQSVKAGVGYSGKVVIMYLDAVISSEQSGFYVYDSVSKTFARYNEIQQPQISYIILPITSSMELPSGYRIEEAQINGVNVSVLKGSSDEYCVFYGINSDGISGWYSYDYKYNTIQRFFAFPDTIISQSNVQDVSADTDDSGFFSGSMFWKIISLASAAVAVISIITACVCAAKASKNGKIARELVGGSFDDDEDIFEDDEDSLEDENYYDEDFPDGENDEYENADVLDETEYSGEEQETNAEKENENVPQQTNGEEQNEIENEDSSPETSDDSVELLDISELSEDKDNNTR